MKRGETESSGQQIRGYKFGPFTLMRRPHAQFKPIQLRIGSAPVREIEKSDIACRLLLYLVENHETKLQAKTIADLLWPGKKAEEQKSSLTQAVTALRNALDPSNRDAYIIRGSGDIQFVAEVVPIYEESAVDRGTAVPSKQQPASASLDVSWIPRLNRFVEGTAIEIVRLLEIEPEIVDRGLIPISDSEEDLAVKKRGEVLLNDRLGVLPEMPFLDDNPITLQVWETEYAVLDVLTALGKRPIQVSGAVLTVCNDTEELVLHRRSPKSRDYPHAIHTEIARIVVES